MSGLSPDEIAAMARRLRTRRAELMASGERTRADRAPVALDQASVGRLSRIDAIQGQQMALEAERRRRREIVRIDAALARIAAGEFGWCASCGEPIDAGRLDVDPTNPRCIACARG
jgi:DnaK suppressor protein